MAVFNPTAILMCCYCTNKNKEIKMESLHNIIEKVFIFDKEPQKIGLSQFKEPVKKEKKESKLTENGLKSQPVSARTTKSNFI